jgi:hypothetical protein
VITLPELVALLYQADWKRLSLLARISWARDRAADRQFRQRSESDLQRRTWTAVTRLTGMRDPDEPSPGDLEQESRVLLAPGGRFRVEAVADGTVAAVGDGERRWALIADLAHRRPGDGPGGALHGLLTPQWLLAWYDLEVTGQAEVAGRPAHRVTATPRRVSRPLADRYDRLDRVEVLVDAALGILLRSEQVFGGQVLERAELHDLVLDPPEAAGAALFALPSHVRDMDQAAGSEPSGRGWQAAGAAAGAAASAMGFAARHIPRQAARRTPGDTEPVMPADARRGPAPAADRSPAGAGLANLLHGTGRPPPAFSAELHRWQDDEAYTEILQGYRGALPPWLDGILGPDALWDALADYGPEDSSEHQTARLRVGRPGRYRIDYRTGNWHVRYAAIACDGTQTRKIFADRVAVGPARPLTIDIASLVDPAWLLSTWRLSAAGPARVAGRAGFRIVAEPTQGRAAAMGFSLVEVIVDAELGILLQRTSFAGDRPAVRAELRDVQAAADRNAGFGADDAAGLRVVTDSGGLLSDRDLPRPLQAAGAAAAVAGLGAAAGAVAVTGWLDKHRSRRRPGA